jgi:hypothetical protein
LCHFPAKLLVLQAGRIEMEQGVYNWLVRNGVNPGTIKITSVLDNTQRSNQFTQGVVTQSLPEDYAASIVQLTEFDYGSNKTVVIKSAQEAVAPTATELAEGAAALDQLIAAKEAEEPAGDGVTAQSTWTPRGRVPRRGGSVSWGILVVLFWLSLLS